ncbi:MAG TPA: hypothetical protein VGJ21_03570 [Terracidiphilus sp.]|jgi:hypothetical protein
MQRICAICIGTGAIGLALASAALVTAQTARPDPTRAVDCQNPPPVDSSHTAFADENSGFRFEYPAYLELETGTLSFRNPECGHPFQFGGNIRIEVTLPRAYEKPFYPQNRVRVDRQDINGLHWENFFADDGQVEFCVYSSGEQACIVAFDTSSAHRIPPAAIDAMRVIESSFVFTDPSRRMDAKISAIRVGDRYGTLTVRRVASREEVRRSPRAYIGSAPDSFGEVDFSGELKLKARIEDFRTMNSPSDRCAQPDDDALPQLPLGLGRNRWKGIQLTIPPRLAGQLRTANDPNTMLVLRNIRASIGPAGGWSEAYADLAGFARIE